MKPKPLNGAKLNREVNRKKYWVANRMPNNSVKPTPQSGAF
jgi:hypothetical protein